MLGWNAYDGYDFGKFNYQGTYNVNDSIDVYIHDFDICFKCDST